MRRREPARGGAWIPPRHREVPQPGLEHSPKQVSSNLSLPDFGSALKHRFVRKEEWRGPATCRRSAIARTLSTRAPGMAGHLWGARDWCAQTPPREVRWAGSLEALRAANAKTVMMPSVAPGTLRCTWVLGARGGKKRFWLGDTGISSVSKWKGLSKGDTLLRNGFRSVSRRAVYTWTARSFYLDCIWGRSGEQAMEGLGAKLITDRAGVRRWARRAARRAQR